jgi:hypothetical protein
MICQDDNFSKRTRHYGNLKADIVLCPTADWWTIKDAHLQAVRARSIECRYGIVRGAANGITAAISARGKVLSQVDHYKSGPGFIIEDIPVYRNKTFFSRFGHRPSLAAMGICIGLFYTQTGWLSNLSRVRVSTSQYNWRSLKSGFAFCWQQTGPKTYNSTLSSFSPEKVFLINPHDRSRIITRALYTGLAPNTRKNSPTSRNLFIMGKL